MAFFRPRLVESLKQYDLRTFISDAGAGLTVAIIALPLALAFAIASGVRPEAGLFTAIVAGFLISGLGGSRVQIGGPTGAFVVLIFSIVARYGVADLALCTVMAGAILIIMGAARMGGLVKYIPYPVTTGFTTGIAILIMSTEVKDFFGMSLAQVPAHFIPKVIALAHAMPTLDRPTLALAAGSVLLIALWPKPIARFVPGPVAALVLGTLAVVALHLQVETIGTRFGGIPRTLPAFHWPAMQVQHMGTLLRPAITIALLAAIESLLSAVVADGMINDRHDSNQELIAQGCANIVSPLFGGIPATGAIVRTSANIRNGARSPIAGMMHAISLLLIMMAAAPFGRFIPLATLSAILMVVAYQMGEWEELFHLRKLPKSDAAVLLSVFVLTVLTDLTVAVEVGMMLAALLFIKRIADNTAITLVDESTETEGDQHSLRGKKIPHDVMVYRVFGAFLFGATEKLEEFVRTLDDSPRILILRLRKIVAMDATGVNALARLREHLAMHGKSLILAGVQAQPLRVMERSGFLEQLGAENLCKDLDTALARAQLLRKQGGKGHAATAGMV